MALVTYLVVWSWPSASDDVRSKAGLIATFLAAGTVIASVYSIVQHMRYYTDRHVQARIIRILWLPPVYAVSSMIGLRGEAWCCNHPVPALADILPYLIAFVCAT